MIGTRLQLNEQIWNILPNKMLEHVLIIKDWPFSTELKFFFSWTLWRLRKILGTWRQMVSFIQVIQRYWMSTNVGNSYTKTLTFWFVIIFDNQLQLSPNIMSLFVPSFWHFWQVLFFKKLPFKFTILTTFSKVKIYLI